MPAPSSRSRTRADHRAIGRPTRLELSAAEGTTVPDLVAPGLDVLFCGINPGLWSAAVGHHFAHPGNRFWKALHASGFTNELLAAADERQLLAAGTGVTNLVDRATASARDLGGDELRRGAARLTRKARRWRPKVVAVLGITAYRVAFEQPRGGIGPQEQGLADSRLWVLPNPSGLQGHYQLDFVVAELRRLRRSVGR
jgi:double-stranded uracil-DNA glycosylase